MIFYQINWYEGDVVINDPIENYEIAADSVSYFKNQIKS